MGRITLIDKTIRVVGMRAERRGMIGVKDGIVDVMRVRGGKFMESMGIMG
jgi:hypothetical protein